MPGFDGTGPGGMGPMTGGGRGYCAVPGRVYYGEARMGRFSGRGGGRGWRNMYYATGLTGWQRAGYPTYGTDYPPSAEEEKDILKREAEVLKRELEDIQSRIKTLDGSQKDH